MKPTRTVKTADTLLSVVNNLQELDGAGVTELAEHLGLAKSTVHDHLATLREHGYVIREGDTFYLSLRFLEHGTYSRNRLSRRDCVVPSLRNLAEDTGQTVWFAVEENDELVYLFREIGDRGIDLVRRSGTRAPLHTTAAGKAIMATYSEERVREIAEDRKLTIRTQRTVTDVEELLEQLDAIRTDGVAVASGEDYRGVRSVAAEVVLDGDLIGAVSVSGPERRLAGERLEETRVDLLTAINEIEVRLRNDSCS